MNSRQLGPSALTQVVEVDSFMIPRRSQVLRSPDFYLEVRLGILLREAMKPETCFY